VLLTTLKIIGRIITNINKMKNKNLIIGVIALGLVGVGFYMWKKKQNKPPMDTTSIPETIAGTPPASTPPASTPPASTTPSTDIVQWLADPTKAVFVIIDGKKYGFMSEKAFVSYGYSIPRTITEEELKAIPSGGFVDENGKVIKN
jgi:hypothetical protein